MERNPRWVVASESLDLGIEDPQCHASTICETPAGLAVAFFGGPHGGTVDGGIWLARLSAEQWAAAERIALRSDRSSMLWNPVLHAMPDGTILCFYKEGATIAEWRGMQQLSTDGGRTWTESTALPSEFLGPVRNKPVDLDDGSLLCGSSTEHDAWCVHFERTLDAGATWSRTPPIRDDGNFGAIQPTVLLWAANRWQALCRSRAGRVVETVSADEGRSWSALRATPLPNPNSAIDAVTLQDGRGLLVYNPTTPGSHIHANRSVLAVATSADQGKTWHRVGTLEEREGGEFSYPAVLQTRDDLVHVTYTAGEGWTGLRHVVIDPKHVPA